MKKFLCVLVVILLALGIEQARAQKYEYLQVSSIESVIPGGLGRSRLIAQYPGGKEEEIKLKNFFSVTGINFNNVRKNDDDIASFITQLSESGWELHHISTGTYSSASVGTGGGIGKIGGGVSANVGIFITRYLFRHQKQE